MFERFTDRARRVVVLAQEEARMLNHNYIGTEHILLGLIREGDGVAAQIITRRSPKRFMNAAANGPNNPNSKSRSASAEEICALSQPNSCSSGTISTPGAPMAPAVTSMVRKVTVTTTQP